MVGNLTRADIDGIHNHECSSFILHMLYGKLHREEIAVFPAVHALIGEGAMFLQAFPHQRVGTGSEIWSNIAYPEKSKFFHVVSQFPACSLVDEKKAPALVYPESGNR